MNGRMGYPFSKKIMLTRRTLIVIISFVRMSIARSFASMTSLAPNNHFPLRPKTGMLMAISGDRSTKSSDEFRQRVEPKRRCGLIRRDERRGVSRMTSSFLIKSRSQATLIVLRRLPAIATPVRICLPDLTSS